MSDDKEAKSVDSPWGKIKNFNGKPLRQPNTSPEMNLLLSSKNDVNQGSEVLEQKNTLNINDGIVRNSKLNVNAAEFIPWSVKNQINLTAESTENILTFFRNELSTLTMSPGKYNEISEALCEEIRPYKNNENVLKSVVRLLVEECITESNLRYNGVRLCSDLNKLCGISFKRILLTSCQEEHTKFLTNESPNDPGYLNRLCGFGLFLAELFLQIQIEEKCIVVLGEGLLNILQIILNCESEKSIKCVCQVLKLTGIKLEEISESSSKKLDEIFSRLQQIRAYPDLDPNHRFTINNVLEMRNSNWGQNRSEESSSEPAPVNTVDFNEPVFFGPDGKIITEEETSFLHDNIPLSGDTEDYVCDQDLMDEEAYRAFEEFLKIKKKGENK